MRHAALRLTAIGALAALTLALAGCGGASKTSQTETQAKATTSSRPASNGLERKSATQVLRAAAAAFKAAKSVHVRGTGVDLRLQGRAGSGTIEQQGTRLAVITVGDDTWLKGDRRALKQMGLPAELLPRLAGRWLKANKNTTDLDGFSLNSFAAALLHADGLLPTVEQSTLGGRPVVVISQKDGSKLYIANSGPAYPLHGENGKDNPGRFDFTEYGADFHITPPQDAVDLDQVG